MTHSFEVEVAVKYGVNAAVLLHNIHHWCLKNKANEKNYHDGMYWTYNSRTAFSRLFPYLSERQVKTALDKLIEDGIIAIGDYNNDRWKRPTWYAVTEKGFSLLQNSTYDDAEMSDRSDKSAISTITDINTDRNADRKPDKSVMCDCPGFDDFWNVYPRHVAKQNALKSWKALKPNDELLQAILADVNRRLGGEWRGKDMQYIPHPSTYLNQRRWEDETEVTRVAEHREPDAIVLTAEEEREIERIYAQNGRDAWM